MGEQVTDPTLTEWHALLASARERFPDAPGLPQMYFFVPPPKAFPEDGYILHFGLSEDPPERGYFVPHASALCVMLDWAIRFGAWWEDAASARDFSVFSISSRWFWSCDNYQDFSFESMSDTHHAAYFAAVQAIVGGGE
jgi:hypothetical protein